MTAYSLKTASKGCTAAVTLTITKAGDIHDNSAYILEMTKPEAEHLFAHDVVQFVSWKLAVRLRDRRQWTNTDII